MERDHAFAIAMVAVLVAATTLVVIYYHPAPPRVVTFGDAAANKAAYAGWTQYRFVNGTVIWFGSTTDVKLAVVAPNELIANGTANLTDSQYIGVDSPVALAVGDMVSVVGNVDVAHNSTDTIYYIRARSVDVVGTANVTDPPFAAMLDLLHQQRLDDFFASYIIVFIVIWMSDYGDPADTGSDYGDPTADPGTDPGADPGADPATDPTVDPGTGGVV